MWAGGSWLRVLKFRGGAWRAAFSPMVLILMDLLAMWSKVTVHPASLDNRFRSFSEFLFLSSGSLLLQSEASCLILLRGAAASFVLCLRYPQIGLVYSA